MAKLTNEYIDSLINKAEKHMYITPDCKAMAVTAIFPCGWVISSTANVISGQKFVEEELRDKCLVGLLISLTLSPTLYFIFVCLLLPQKSHLILVRGKIKRSACIVRPEKKLGIFAAKWTRLD